MFISEGLTLPCYAVIFSSVRRMDDGEYDTMAEDIDALVQNEEGFLGMESVRRADGAGITVCYWRTLADVKRWKEQTLHKEAQRRGKEEWYKEFSLRITEVKETYEWK